MTSVVKTLFVRGRLNEEGSLEVKIPFEDAFLGVGRWRLCFDTFLYSPEISSVNQLVSVSTNVIRSHGLYKQGTGGTEETILGPTRLIIDVVPTLTKNIAVRIGSQRKEWIEITNQSNHIIIYVQNMMSDKGMKGTIYATILYERVPE